MIKTSIRKDQLTKFITEAEKPKKKKLFVTFDNLKTQHLQKKKKFQYEEKKKKEKSFPFETFFP